MSKSTSTRRNNIYISFTEIIVLFHDTTATKTATLETIGKEERIWRQLEHGWKRWLTAIENTSRGTVSLLLVRRIFRIFRPLFNPLFHIKKNPVALKSGKKKRRKKERKKRLRAAADVSGARLQPHFPDKKICEGNMWLLVRFRFGHVLADYTLYNLDQRSRRAILPRVIVARVQTFVPAFGIVVRRRVTLFFPRPWSEFLVSSPRYGTVQKTSRKRPPTELGHVVVRENAKQCDRTKQTRNWGSEHRVADGIEHTRLASRFESNFYVSWEYLLYWPIDSPFLQFLFDNYLTIIFFISSNSSS